MAYSIQQEALPLSTHEVLIVVLPKPGKDPKHCDSYRLISLLPADVKILAKLLANRHNQFITTLIHPDQISFIPDKSTSINNKQVFANIQCNHSNNGSRILVSLDTQKSFDSVKLLYLYAVLDWFGYGDTLINEVCLLYHTSVAIHSPLPAVCHFHYKPLEAGMQSDGRIQCSEVSSSVEKIALYVHDMIFFLADPGISISTSLAATEGFGYCLSLSIILNHSYSQ